MSIAIHLSCYAALPSLTTQHLKPTARRRACRVLCRNDREERVGSRGFGVQKNAAEKLSGRSPSEWLPNTRLSRSQKRRWQKEVLREVQLVRPLLLACEQGDLEAVTGLLTQPGVDVNARLCHLHAHGGHVALHRAAASGNLEVVRLLLDSGAEVDIAWCSRGYAFTALSMACLQGHSEVVKLLLERGALMGGREVSCWRAPSEALEEGSSTLVEQRGLSEANLKDEGVEGGEKRDTLEGEVHGLKEDAEGPAEPGEEKDADLQAHGGFGEEERMELAHAACLAVMASAPDCLRSLLSADFEPDAIFAQEFIEVGRMSLLGLAAMRVLEPPAGCRDHAWECLHLILERTDDVDLRFEMTRGGATLEVTVLCATVVLMQVADEDSHLAALELVSIFTDCGAEVNVAWCDDAAYDARPGSTGRVGQTPLSMACWQQSYEMVELLLQRGAADWLNQEAVDAGPLHLPAVISVHLHDPRVLAALLSAGVRPDECFDNLLHPRHRGESLLGTAVVSLASCVRNNQVDEEKLSRAWECLGLVLAHTADVNVHYTVTPRHPRGKPYVVNALHRAFRHGPVSLARTLLEAGGSPGGWCIWRNGTVNHPLDTVIEASAEGDMDQAVALFELLLKHGVEPDAAMPAEDFWMLRERIEGDLAAEVARLGAPKAALQSLLSQALVNAKQEMAAAAGMSAEERGAELGWRAAAATAAAVASATMWASQREERHATLLAVIRSDDPGSAMGTLTAPPLIRAAEAARVAGSSSLALALLTPSSRRFVVDHRLALVLAAASVPCPQLLQAILRPDVPQATPDSSDAGAQEIETELLSEALCILCRGSWLHVREVDTSNSGAASAALAAKQDAALEVAGLLLDHGAELNSEGNGEGSGLELYGYGSPTPLELACFAVIEPTSRGRAAEVMRDPYFLVKYLLRRGADPCYGLLDASASDPAPAAGAAADEARHTPAALALAAGALDTELMRLLLRSGAAPSAGHALVLGVAELAEWSLPAVQQHMVRLLVRVGASVAIDVYPGDALTWLAELVAAETSAPEIGTAAPATATSAPRTVSALDVVRQAPRGRALGDPPNDPPNDSPNDPLNDPPNAPLNAPPNDPPNDPRPSEFPSE
ncbi:hypothetical protein CYMTET_18833 [Cymbomonas tetramitiformis]|uniref:Uncharacterized protein n=1 Tax=Cymbomonas tetramitiformis TaxID=36881 RepID=A0AAE0L5J6_9CHLO|nr:hypothetical protein CYMTET_18833 [Cymbomonas tetramitiformis]